MTIERVEGLDKLSNTLQFLGKKAALKILKPAVSSGAIIIKNLAKSLAPISKFTRRGKAGNKPPGTLKRAAITKFVREQSSDSQVTYIVTFRRGKKEQPMNRDAFYAQWVEFGHKIVPRRGAKRLTLNQRRRAATSFVSSRKFLGPAFTQKVSEAIRLIKARVEIGIDKYFKN